MAEPSHASGLPAHCVRLLAVLLLLSGAIAPRVGAAPLDEMIGDPNKDWTELGPDLPGPPQDPQLIEFYVSPVTSFHFALDRASINIGGDGVVHYTLVATSRGGVRNIRFEGLRCATNSFKVYAIARPDGSWERVEAPVWKHISEAIGNREEAALSKDAICANGIAFSVDDIVRHLKASAHAPFQR